MAQNWKPAISGESSARGRPISGPSPAEISQRGRGLEGPPGPPFPPGPGGPSRASLPTRTPGHAREREGERHGTCWGGRSRHHARGLAFAPAHFCPAVLYPEYRGPVFAAAPLPAFPYPREQGSPLPCSRGAADQRPVVSPPQAVGPSPSSALLEGTPQKNLEPLALQLMQSINFLSGSSVSCPPRTGFPSARQPLPGMPLLPALPPSATVGGSRAR